MPEGGSEARFQQALVGLLGIRSLYIMKAIDFQTWHYFSDRGVGIGISAPELSISSTGRRFCSQEQTGP